MEQTWENIPDQFTSDGVKIVPGLKVWDYDYRENVVVEPVRYGNPAESVWFKCANNKIFDGSRLSVRRPW